MQIGWGNLGKDHLLSSNSPCLLAFAKQPMFLKGS